MVEDADDPVRFLSKARGSDPDARGQLTRVLTRAIREYVRPVPPPPEEDPLTPQLHAPEQACLDRLLGDARSAPASDAGWRYVVREVATWRLIESSRAHNQLAMTKLIEIYRPILCGILLTGPGGENEQAYWDVWLDVYLNLGRLDPAKGYFSAYLREAARRRRGRMRHESEASTSVGYPPWYIVVSILQAGRLPDGVGPVPFLLYCFRKPLRYTPARIEHELLDLFCADIVQRLCREFPSDPDGASGKPLGAEPFEWLSRDCRSLGRLNESVQEGNQLARQVEDAATAVERAASRWLDTHFDRPPKSRMVPLDAMPEAGPHGAEGFLPPPETEQIGEPAAVYMEFFRDLAEIEATSFQIIAFLFNKLLSYLPQRIEDELNGKSAEHLWKRFVKEYLAASKVPAPVCGRVFHLLEPRVTDATTPFICSRTQVTRWTEKVGRHLKRRLRDKEVEFLQFVFDAWRPDGVLQPQPERLLAFLMLGLLGCQPQQAVSHKYFGLTLPRLGRVLTKLYQGVSLEPNKVPGVFGPWRKRLETQRHDSTMPGIIDDQNPALGLTRWRDEIRKQLRADLGDRAIQVDHLHEWLARARQARGGRDRLGAI